MQSKSGELLLPKKLTAMAIRSRLKQEIQDRYQVDICDPCYFPEAVKKWKALMNTIVAAGRYETTHHAEVKPATMLAIYQLLGAVVKALKARGTPEYKDLLDKIPVDLQGKQNRVMQWGAMLVIMMFEVRRGQEGIEYLTIDNFQVFEDDVYEFKYIRKVYAEPEKNNQMGSNTGCHGVIPDIQFTNDFNPFVLFYNYLGLLPEEPNKDGKRYLFPSSRRPSAKFDPHNPDHRMYDINSKSKLVFQLSWFLCAK